MNIEKISVGGNQYDVCDAKARAMISDEYNPATQYSEGDYCIYENTLKKANKNTTGTFDPTAWDDTNLVEAVGELNQKISNCYDKNQVDGFLDGYKFRILQAQLQFANGSAIWEDDLSDLGGALYFASVNGLAVNDTFACSITNGTAASARLIVWELNTPGFSGAVNIRILVVCK